MTGNDSMGDGPYGPLSIEDKLRAITNTIWSMASSPEEARVISLEAAGLIHLYSNRGDDYDICKRSFLESVNLWMDRNEWYYAGL